MATGTCALRVVVRVRGKLGDLGAEAHYPRWTTRAAARLESGIDPVGTS